MSSVKTSSLKQLMSRPSKVTSSVWFHSGSTQALWSAPTTVSFHSLDQRLFHSTPRTVKLTRSNTWWLVATAKSSASSRRKMLMISNNRILWCALLRCIHTMTAIVTSITMSIRSTRSIQRQDFTSWCCLTKPMQSTRTPNGASTNWRQRSLTAVTIMAKWSSTLISSLVKTRARVFTFTASIKAKMCSRSKEAKSWSTTFLRVSTVQRLMRTTSQRLMDWTSQREVSTCSPTASTLKQKQGGKDTESLTPYASSWRMTSQVLTSWWSSWTYQLPQTTILSKLKQKQMDSKAWTRRQSSCYSSLTWALF